MNKSGLTKQSEECFLTESQEDGLDDKLEFMER